MPSHFLLMEDGVCSVGLGFRSEGCDSHCWKGLWARKLSGCVDPAVAERDALQKNAEAEAKAAEAAAAAPPEAVAAPAADQPAPAEEAAQGPPPAEGPPSAPAAAAGAEVPQSGSQGDERHSPDKNAPGQAAAPEGASLESVAKPPKRMKVLYIQERSEHDKQVRRWTACAVPTSLHLTLQKIVLGALVCRLLSILVWVYSSLELW